MPTDQRAYLRLRRLRESLPPDTRIIAGLVDERQPLALQIRIRDMVEDVVREPVDVAAPCGLGRREREVAALIVQSMMELALS